MTEWAAKRFWQATSVRRTAEGWEVLLDTRVLKTPGKLTLTLPSRALADAIAAEWDAVDGAIRPTEMPMTRLANTALEKVAPQQAAVMDEILAYGGTDLVCYRAAEPESLVARQAVHWDPLVDWAARHHHAPLTITTGVIPVAQPAATMAAFRDVVGALDAFGLTALYELTALSGSLVIGLAALAGQDGAAFWTASRVDEDWQAETWGVDEEAAETAARKRNDFMTALRFWQLLRA